MELKVKSSQGLRYINVTPQILKTKDFLLFVSSTPKTRITKKIVEHFMKNQKGIKTF